MGGIYAERNQIGGTLSNWEHDLFGGGQQSTALPFGVIRNQVYVYIDGKQVTTAVVKQVQRQAARK